MFSHFGGITSDQTRANVLLVTKSGHSLTSALSTCAHYHQFFFLIFIYFKREREKERAHKQREGAEREDRENSKQVLHCQHRARHGARSHEP